MEDAIREAKLEMAREAIGDCPICLEAILDPPIYQCRVSSCHILCSACWKQVYNGGEGLCPTCRGRLSDRRNIPLERILEKLDKKKCKFDDCKFERNSQALITEHEETCAHKTFKCKWSAQGCNFEANKALIREHEDNCEHSLSQQLEAELSIAGAAKMEKPKKDKRNRKGEAPATLMPDGLCRKHHKYRERAHKCDLPSQCTWNNDWMPPTTPDPSFEQRKMSVLDAEVSVCKFHGCLFRNRNPRKVKRHEFTECRFRHLSFEDYLDAAVSGDMNVIRNMIEYRKEKNPADLTGNTPLHEAAAQGHVEAVKLILQTVQEKNPANMVGLTPLHAAAGDGHVEVVKLILQAVEEKNPANKDGWTPLHATAQQGHAEVVKLILPTLQEKNPAGKDGWTPLHSAAAKGHVEVVNLILESVTEKNPKAKNGSTPLHVATLGGHVEIVKLILPTLKEKNPADEDDWTPLHVAARYGHVEVVNLILQTIIDMNPKNKDGMTPLQLAAHEGHEEVVRVLTM